MKAAAEIRGVDCETGTRDASRARDRIIYNWDQWELFVTGSINKRLMRPVLLSAGQNMAEIQLQRRSRDTKQLASLASLARVRVELARIRPPVSQPRRQFSFFSRFILSGHATSLKTSIAPSLLTLRLWLSTNKPRDNDDDSTVFSILVIDKKVSRWRPRSNIGQTAFSNHKCIWELSVRAPGHRRIRNTETKHGTKLRPESNFRPKNGTESSLQQLQRENRSRSRILSLFHWLWRAVPVLFGIMSVCGGFFNIFNMQMW